MVHSEDISVRSGQRCHWVDITAKVADIVSGCGVNTGVVTVASLHTTAAITLNENADPDVERDFFWKLGALIPQEAGYRHGEGNSDSHLKASMVGLSVQVPVRDGRPVLGTWQSIYFCEFDGPRNRHVTVTVVGE